MNHPSKPPDWTAVDAFVKKRLAENKDVFGWMRLEGADEASALILADESVEPASFPAKVGGVRIQLKRVPTPVRL